MIAYLTAIELRRHWRSTLLVAVLVAMVVGTVLAATAGARRSSTAFDRYLDDLVAPDAMAFGDPAVRSRLDELPGVAHALDMDLPAVWPPGDDFFYPMVAEPSGTILYEMVRLPVVDGRLPDPDEPLEMVVSERTADRLGVGAGDELAMESATPAQRGRSSPRAAATLSPTARSSRSPSSAWCAIPATSVLARTTSRSSYLSPAFRREHPLEEIGTLTEGTFIKMRPGHPLRSVTEAVRGEEVELDTSFISTDALRRQIEPTTQAIGTALLVFGGVVALAGIAALAQVVARLQQTIGDDDRTLAALGVPRSTRWIRLVVSGATAVTAGTVIGIGRRRRGVAAVPDRSVPAGRARPGSARRRARPRPRRGRGAGGGAGPPRLAGRWHGFDGRARPTLVCESAVRAASRPARAHPRRW